MKVNDESLGHSHYIGQSNEKERLTPTVMQFLQGQGEQGNNPIL